MKGRVIALEKAADGSSRAALLVDGRLEDFLHADPAAPGDYCVDDLVTGQIDRVLPKSGAFVTLPDGSSGYLRDAKGVRQGDWHILRVSALPDGDKALTVTRRVLLKAPHVILTPGAPGVNVSRKIGNWAERERLAEVFAEENGSEDGLIVRTSARGTDAPVLRAEVASLRARWSALSLALTSRTHAEDRQGSPIEVALREWMDPAPDEICTTPDAVAGRPFGGITPRSAPSPFDETGAEDQLRDLSSSVANLPSGRMIMETTRAAVVVDVDTGGTFTPAAGLRINLDVARALPRQLRLRGLGGQVIVDFAPMQKTHRRTLEEALARAFRADNVETSLIGWTRLGLFEIQRKRERRPWQPL